MSEIEDKWAALGPALSEYAVAASRSIVTKKTYRIDVDAALARVAEAARALALAAARRILEHEAEDRLVGEEVGVERLGDLHLVIDHYATRTGPDEVRGWCCRFHMVAAEIERLGS